ncbi:hypothetical protein SDC9_194363 [bioreactor metagenome]|uniref:Uncharacterized protein n=1 Tax=bioreactor metagenome TaxID=1076179 RepID=A0A645I625_9ZZZZ
MAQRRDIDADAFGSVKQGGPGFDRNFNSVYFQSDCLTHSGNSFPYDSIRLLKNNDGIKATNIIAFAALNTCRRVNVMRFLHFAADGRCRAFPRTQGATCAFFGVNRICQQRFATFCGATAVADVRFVFVAKIAQRGKHGIRRGLSEPAKRTGFNLIAKVFEQVDVAVTPLTVTNALKDF